MFHQCNLFVNPSLCLGCSVFLPVCVHFSLSRYYFVSFLLSLRVPVVVTLSVPNCTDHLTAERHATRFTVCISIPRFFFVFWEVYPYVRQTAVASDCDAHFCGSLAAVT